MPRKRTYTDEQLICAVKNSKSLYEVARNLNMVKLTGIIKTIKDLNINTNHFHGYYKTSDNEFVQACLESTSINELIDRLGMYKDNKTILLIRKRMKTLDVKVKYPVLTKLEKIRSEYFTNRKMYKNILRRYFKNHSEYKCNGCGINTWNNKPLELYINYKDDNKNNNHLENLEWLCPLCFLLLNKDNTLNVVQYKNLIESHIKECKTINEIAQKTGLKRKTVSRTIKTYNIDISHFKRKTALITPAKDNEKDNRNLKMYITSNNILNNKKCAICNMNNFWQDQEIVFMLDHINGKPEDDRIENLRFICHNCDHQLPTSKNKKAQPA